MNKIKRLESVLVIADKKDAILAEDSLEFTVTYSNGERFRKDYLWICDIAGDTREEFLSSLRNIAEEKEYNQKLYKALRYSRAANKMLDLALVTESPSYSALFRYKGLIYSCKSSLLSEVRPFNLQELELALGHYERAYASAKESFLLPEHLNK